MTELVSVEEHLDSVLTDLEPLGLLDLTLLDAHGCVLAEDVPASFPLPPFDNSAMDGYAVRSEDVASASPESPVVLPVIGDVAAGVATSYRVQPGLCVRIMTGAPVPAGADAIVPQEDTDGGVTQVAIHAPAPAGRHVRRTGEDADPGQVVLAGGTHLGATQIALAAAVGRERLHVRPRPRVVVLSTGSELVEPGQRLGIGQIPDSNSLMLTAAVREAGAIGYRVGFVADDPALLVDTLEDQLIRADLVLTSGGVSVGAHDIVKDTMNRLGNVRFVKVAMQPGMPQGAGTIGPDRTPFFGLPGNPVSAYVSFEVFVRPAIRRLLGVEPIHRPMVRATLTGDITSPPGRRSYLRGMIAYHGGGYLATPVGAPASHLIASLAHANCFIVVPEDVTSVPAESTVQVMLLERRQL
jgi:molybdopterin molybdotransferase